MVLKMYFEQTKGNVDIKVRSISARTYELTSGMDALFSLALLAHTCIQQQLSVDEGGSHIGLPAQGLCRFLRLSDFQKSDFRGVTEGTTRVEHRTWH